MQVFYQTFNNKYPLSRIRLCNNLSQYNLSQPGLDQDSVNFLTAMFPGIANPGGPWSQGQLDWTGGQTSTTLPITLEGDQCLVFFLGGMVVNNNGMPTCIGFSKYTDANGNPNPTYIPPAGTTDPPRYPFYNFKSSRLSPGSTQQLFLLVP